MIDILDNLADRGVFERLDPHDMMGLVLRFPRQCREAAALHFEGGVRLAGISRIVLTGMGGSAIGGEFARCVLDDCGTIPLIVNRDYVLPAWVGPDTLVICASYSGNTEETLAAYCAARSAGAPICAITSGGALRAAATEDGYPLAIVPGGQPPRSAAGYMFLPLLNLFREIGVISSDLRSDLDEMFGVLGGIAARLGPSVPTVDNPAKQMAAALHGRLPVVYGSQGYRGAVAMRWKGQFNENAKQAAFANVLPEQNHIEALAWVTAQRQASNWSMVLLRDRTEPERIARRVELTRELTGPDTECHEVWAEGKSLLARMFSLIYFADFMTVYLAYLNGVCPTDMASLDYLKTELARIP
jgi:glucose/mannose-6-phosphate isomerase